MSQNEKTLNPHGAEREMSRADASLRARYRQLLGRARLDLKLAHDAALALGTPYARRARLHRASREVGDELKEAR